MLVLHSARRPLSYDEERQEEITAWVQRCKADVPPPIVRPLEGGRYEVIDGGYRVEAFRALGSRTTRVVVRELGDDDALRELVQANRGERVDNLEAAFILYPLVKRHSKTGKSAAALTQELHWDRRKASRMLQAVEVLREVRERRTGRTLLRDPSILAVIHRADRQAWCALHDLVLEQRERGEDRWGLPRPRLRALVNKLKKVPFACELTLGNPQERLDEKTEHIRRLLSDLIGEDSLPVPEVSDDSSDLPNPYPGVEGQPEPDPKPTPGVPLPAEPEPKDRVPELPLWEIRSPDGSFYASWDGAREHRVVCAERHGTDLFEIHRILSHRPDALPAILARLQEGDDE